MLLHKPLNPKKFAKIYYLYYANLKIYLCKRNFSACRNFISTSLHSGIPRIFERGVIHLQLNMFSRKFFQVY